MPATVRGTELERRAAPVLAALLLLAAGTSALEPSPPAAGTPYEPLMVRARIPGMTVAVIEGGRVVRTAVLGVSNAETGDPVTEATLFEAASLSKPVFATIVLRMAERGELDLDQPLHELLSYERISHDPHSKALTARLVLSHQTGLPNWGPERLEFGFDPGERFAYSGEGYVYLQRVLEKKTGHSLDELARREIFDLLGMDHSRFSWPQGEALPLAAPHDESGRPQAKREPHEGNAAASLHTTAADYARLIVGWMGGELLRSPTVEAALAPSVSVPEDEAESEKPRATRAPIAWGLGWGLQLSEAEGGEPIAWHWGDNGPFKAFAAFRPRTRSGIVYFANGQNGLAIGRAMVADIVGDMEAAFGWAGYASHAAPGFSERLEGLVAENDRRYREAIKHSRAALAADPDDARTAQRIEWLEDLVRAHETPVIVPPETLARYAGGYGPRILGFEQGELKYRREGRPESRLIALSQTLFALEGMVDFRLEVVLDEAGAPLKLVGHYLGGRTDENPRDPAATR